MKVILIKEVASLGKVGETIVVKDGYGRNFLIPRGLALPATPSYRSKMQSLLAVQHRQEALRKEKAAELRARLEGTTCTIPAPVGDQEKLHGAVTAGDIVQALERQGVRLDRHQIELEQPITRLGSYAVPVKLHPEVAATLRIQIVRK